MKRPQLIAPSSLNRKLQAANEAWEHRDFQQCFELLERLSRLDPANTKILLRLGQCYGLRYDYAEADRCFEKAVRVTPKKTEVLMAASQLAVGFANPQLAERYFLKAVKQKNVPAETFARMAEFYERLRRIEEASQLVEQALQLDPNCALARLTRARLNRQAGRLEEAERSLRPMLAAAERHIRARGYYELGAILDRQGRYDEAMTVFLEAKAILRPEAQPLLAKLQANRVVIRKREYEFTAEALQRWFDFGSQLQPARRLVFLGGHPRSGTTLLEQVLDSHPDIVSAEETPVFMDDAFLPLRSGLPKDSLILPTLEAAPAGALQQSRARYFRSMELHLNKTIGGKLLIDKNPPKTLFIPAFVRIFPEAKILVALRDPRDVVLSCFMQTYVPVAIGSVSFLSLENASDDFAFVMAGWRKYSTFLKNPWLEVRYEDVVEDLEGVSRRVLDFLGVSWNPDVLKFDEHARQKVVRSPTYADVTQPVYKRAVGRWRNYQKYVEPYLDRLEPFVKAFGYE